jgi:hypothetical protein
LAPAQIHLFTVWVAEFCSVRLGCEKYLAAFRAGEFMARPRGDVSGAVFSPICGVCEARRL